MENQQFDENNFNQENDIVNSVINNSIHNENNNSEALIENNDLVQRQSLFQENLFEPYLNFNNDLEIELFVNPLIFYHNYDNYSYYDMGKKVLAPKFLLHRLSQYNNIEYPIHIKINNTIFTVYDFIEDIDCVYIPTPIFYNIYLTENTVHPVTIMKNIPPKATYLKMKPMSEELYSIKDVKKYFEIHLTKLYASLHKFEIIKVPYMRSFIEFKVTDCKPENIVSINEIEELQIEFEPLVEKQMEFTFDSESDENIDLKEDKNIIEETTTETDPQVFIPFSGKGNKLGSK
jgi:hypothetical protein